MLNNRKIRRTLIVLISVSLLALFITSCGQNQSSGSPSQNVAEKTGTEGPKTSGEELEPIRIGLACAITTEANMGDLFTVDGFNMAVDEINENGGINGRKIEAYTEDTANDNTTAINAYNRLIDYYNVIAVVGPSYSTQHLAVMPIVKEKGVAVFGLGTNVLLTQDYPQYIRVRPSDAIAAKAAANFAIKNLKATKIGITHVNNDFGIGGKDVMLEAFEENSLTPVGIESYGAEEKEYSPLLLSLKEKGAEVIIDWGHQANEAILQIQVKQLGLNIPLVMAPSSLSSTCIDMAGEATDGNYAITDVLLDAKKDERTQQWIKEYVELYDRQPDGTHSNTAYDAVYLLKEAIEKSGSTDPEEILKAIHNIRDFQGMTGVYSFDKGNGEGLSTVDVLQFKGTVPEFIETVSAE